MEVTSEFARSKVKDQDKDQKERRQNRLRLRSSLNSSFTVDLPDMNSQGFSLTEDRNRAGHTKDVPV